MEADVLGVGMPREEALTLEELLCLLLGVGCVAPIIWWVGLGSVMSTGGRDALAEVEDTELAFDATEAD